MDSLLRKKAGRKFCAQGRAFVRPFEVSQELEYARQLGREIMYFSDFERNRQLEG